MNLTDALILAVVQSVTEFIPISSSGHLVIFSKLLGAGEVPVLFDLVLHLGTLTAVVVVYAGRIREIFSDVFGRRHTPSGTDRQLEQKRRGSAKLLWFIIFSTAVTGLIGVLFRTPIESFFHARANVVPLLLILTGAILLATRFVREKKKGISDFGIGYPVTIGIAQAVAMLPGVSRSGTTIAAGLFAGAAREFAGLYSFLLAIPSVLAATGVEYLITRGTAQPTFAAGVYVAAYLLSALVGYGALRLFLGLLLRGRLFMFSFYCFAAGIAGFIFMSR
jgi:undecaprenyl-diphosphatase